MKSESPDVKPKKLTSKKPGVYPKKVVSRTSLAAKKSADATPTPAKKRPSSKPSLAGNKSPDATHPPAKKKPFNKPSPAGEKSKKPGGASRPDAALQTSPDTSLPSSSAVVDAPAPEVTCQNFWNAASRMPVII